MAAYSEEELYDMDDEELEKALKEANESVDIKDDDNDNDNDDGDGEDLEQPNEEGLKVDEEENTDEESTDNDSEQDSDVEEDTGEKEVADETEEDGTEDESDGINDNGEPEKQDKSEENKPVIDLNEKRKFKAVGKDYEFTIQEMLDNYATIFGQAVDYTKKNQVLKKYREITDTAVKADLTVDDLNLLADAIKGKKPEAVAELVKKAGVDPLELEIDEAGDKQYVPDRYGRPADVIELEEMIESISSDPEYPITENVILKQWDENSRTFFQKDPKAIIGLHNDIKNGIFDVVSARAMKKKVLNGGQKSDIEYYIEAGTEYMSEQKQKELAEQAQMLAKQKQEEEAATMRKLKADEAKRKQKSMQAGKRKAAAPTRNRAGTKTVTDYLDDSDEAFEEWYKKLEDSL